MPTLEETLGNITNEVSQISADISDIGAATPTKAGLVAISNDASPDDNSVPTVAFFKNRNIIGSGGEAAGGLPQAELDKVNALPPQEVLAALSSLPASLTGLAGQIIAVNSTGDGYEVVVAPVGGGGGIPTNIVVDHFTGDGSTTAFTLSQSPTNSNALDISVGGISIDPAIYNVSGVTLTFNDAPPITDTNAIVVRHLGTVAAIADGSIITIKIANGAITLPKMANGTPGKYLKYNDSTGVIEEVDAVVGTVGDNTITTPKIVNKNITLAKMADGTPGKFLKFNSSTGVIEEGDSNVISGGGWNLIDTQVASNSAQIDLTTGINSTYDFYMIVINDLIAENNDSDMRIRTSSNGGVSFDANSGDYTWGYQGSRAHGSTADLKGASETEIKCVPKIGNAFGENMSAVLKLFSPANPAIETSIGYECFSIDTDGTGHYFIAGMGVRTAVGSVDALRFFMSSGSIISGKFKLYGIS